MDFIYRYGYYFLIYAFLGWCCEVAYATVRQRKFVNRGFLFGAVCPIYGVGVCVAVLALSPVRDNLFLLYVCSVILMSAIEFVTGWLLERLFNEKWWDYSNTPFNIKGYICLRFSLLWGICCTVIVKFVHRPIAGLVKILPKTLGIIILCLLGAVFITDMVLTLINIMKLRKNTAVMLDLERALKNVSDHLGENISDAVLAAMENKEKNGKRFEEVKEKYNNAVRSKNLPTLEELYRKYKEAADKKRSSTADRIKKAFPNLKDKHLFTLEEKWHKKRK